jgi:predicted deacylase
MRINLSVFVIPFLLLLSCAGNSPGNSRGTAPFVSAGDGAARLLSEYCPSLKGTPGDTAVYVLDSGKPGASILLAAGTHGNEIAGIRAAELFLDFAHVESGRVFVIPRLNNSGVSAGIRLVKAEDQNQSDPDWYTPPEGTARYDGIEQRNINRSYPGTEQAGLAQKVAFAVMNLLVRENIDIAIDMHEARPSSDLAWTIVSNPKNVHIAALAVLDLEEKNIMMHLDVSPPEMDGLSHKEWGNRTQAMAFLIETVNPAQADNPSIDELNDPRYALDRRAAIHLETVRTIVSLSNEALPLPLVISGIPEYSQ